MRTAMLIVHFLGLAMVLGSSFAFLFLGIARSKMEKEEGKKFALNTFAMSSMGHIGLTLSIVSGFYLITPFWGALAAMPMLVAKLALVLTLTITVIILSVYSRRAKNGEAGAHLKTIENLGKLTLLTGIAIAVLAVLIFQ